MDKKENFEYASGSPTGYKKIVKVLYILITVTSLAIIGVLAFFFMEGNNSPKVPIQNVQFAANAEPVEGPFVGLWLLQERYVYDKVRESWIPITEPSEIKLQFDRNGLFCNGFDEDSCVSSGIYRFEGNAIYPSFPDIELDNRYIYFYTNGKLELILQFRNEQNWQDSEKLIMVKV